MDRVLGEVPNVVKEYWDWQAQVAWVRFAPGTSTDAKTLQDAVTSGTMFTASGVTYITKEEDFPDEVR